MIRLSVLATALLLSFCLAGVVDADTVVFEDTFDYGGVPALTNNLSFNQAARQAGGAVTSTYTEQTVGAAVNTAALNLHGGTGNEVLLLRTFNQPGASQTAVDLDTNFASSIAGSTYSLILSGVTFNRSAADITDAWMGISIGDTSPSINGPNNPNADIGFLLRPRETSNNIWRDNSPTTITSWSGTGLGFGNTVGYSQIVITVDEVAGTVSGGVTAPNGFFAFPTLSIGFDNTTDRYIELRGHQGGTGTDGQLMDLRIDSIQLTVVPEPATLALLALGGGLLWLRRRS